MIDCVSDASGKSCLNCGWVKPEKIVGWPRRNCPASTGLGDTIAKITTALGIKPCGGCKKRQTWLNEHFPYHPATIQKEIESAVVAHPLAATQLVDNGSANMSDKREEGN